MGTKQSSRRVRPTPLSIKNIISISWTHKTKCMYKFKDKALFTKLEIQGETYFQVKRGMGGAKSDVSPHQRGSQQGLATVANTVTAYLRIAT